MDEKLKERAWMWIAGGSFLGIYTIFNLIMGEVSFGLTPDFIYSLIMLAASAFSITKGSKMLEVSPVALMTGGTS